MRIHENVQRVERFAVRAAAVDAIGKTIEMDGLRAHPGRGARVLRAAQADGLLGGGKSPLKVKGLRERAGIRLGRESAHQGPGFDADPGADLVVDQSARGKYGVIQMRGNINPAHGAPMSGPYRVLREYIGLRYHGLKSLQTFDSDPMSPDL